MEEYINIGKIDLNKLDKYGKQVVTNNVIITLERIQHIKEKHKEHFDELKNYLKNAIEEPDYILKEIKHDNTIVVLKEIIKDKLRIKIIIKLAMIKEEKRSNSIITFWKIRERDYRKTIEKSSIIYRKS